jgi:hypothetical protein
MGSQRGKWEVMLFYIYMSSFRLDCAQAAASPCPKAESCVVERGEHMCWNDFFFLSGSQFTLKATDFWLKPQCTLSIILTQSLLSVSTINHYCSSFPTSYLHHGPPSCYLEPWMWCDAGRLAVQGTAEWQADWQCQLAPLCLDHCWNITCRNRDSHRW